ncbi:hypothetical protein FZC79_19405 [Rossellomorea vietnamensis]|uniref:Uncharacterized protein n=1 Tax=Rossellomorea vietnamensis TaxID=218284 RepID=A0A5D4K745_9BACI|nr:hypothetical protein [Rossellomorea vietnamensis]TYR73237.1 hypothetical protein FZC79_19405 [Rossellomorea vietnamensis]
MERGVKLLVWGLLFVLIDIRIVTLDLVHDGIGYILLYKGLNELPYSKWVSYAKGAAVILGLLSITEIFGFTTINLNETGQDVTWYVIIGGIVSILSLFFHMNLLSALQETVQDEDELQGSVSGFKTFYLIFNLILIMALPLILIFNDIVSVFLFAALIVGMIVEIVYIVKVNSFKGIVPPQDLAS